MMVLACPLFCSPTGAHRKISIPRMRARLDMLLAAENKTMSKKMLIDAAQSEEIRVAVTDGKKVEDFDFESSSRKPLSGNIYLARVTRVEPSLQAAFVEYGGNRHGFWRLAKSIQTITRSQFLIAKFYKRQKKKWLNWPMNWKFSSAAMMMAKS